MNTIAWAVIGLGRFGAVHAEVISQMPGCKLAAVCGRNPERLAALASRLPDVRHESDYRRLLEDGRIDAVSIVTHVRDHHRLALDALAAGKHVLLEKPMAETPAQCQELVAAAHAAPGIFMVGHICRFDPRVVLAQEAIAAGKLGRIFAMRSKRNLPQAPGALRLDKISPLMGDGVHDADLMMWFMNAAPRRVFGRTVRVDNFQHADAGWALLEFGGQVEPHSATGAATASAAAFDPGSPAAVGVVETVWRLPVNTPTAIDAVLEVVGDAGQLTINCAEAGLQIVDAQRVRFPDTMYWPTALGRRSGALVNELQYFNDCIRRGEQPSVVTPAEAARVVTVMAVAERSAVSGLPEAVEPC